MATLYPREARQLLGVSAATLRRLDAQLRPTRPTRWRSYDSELLERYRATRDQRRSTALTARASREFNAGAAEVARATTLRAGEAAELLGVEVDALAQLDAQLAPTRAPGSRWRIYDRAAVEALAASREVVQ